MAISLMASQTLTLLNPTFPSSPKLPINRRFNLSQTPNLRKFRVLASSSSSSSITPIIPTPDNSSSSLLSVSSTRTITTLFALAQLITKSIAHKFIGFQSCNGLSNGLMFAAVTASGKRINTPITVIASGMAKWLDIYSGVLLVRVLLSWFPTIPWDKQPLAAIRDLCDPYLSLFRGIIPPVMNTLDISPLFAFSVLGALASLLRKT